MEKIPFWIFVSGKNGVVSPFQESPRGYFKYGLTFPFPTGGTRFRLWSARAGIYTYKKSY